MPQIKTVLADDHPDSLEILETLVEQHPGFRLVAKCMDGEELINQVVMYKPDLIITDIKMPKLNGMEAIKKCIQYNPNINFIFVTGYDDYAVEAFNLSAIDYIVKPINMARFFGALEKAAGVIRRQMTKLQPIKSKLKIKSSGSIYYIPMEEIYFIEKQGKKCLIHVKAKTYETNESINELSKKLNDAFFLSHRSNIINLKKVSHITSSNETYLAHFEGFDNHASISKLKIKEVQEKIQQIL